MWESTSSHAFATTHFIYVCQKDNSNLYFNVTDSDTCDCDASFQAQPGIAGVGTVIAFALLSMITIGVAAVPAYYDSIVRIRAIRRSREKRRQEKAAAEAPSNTSTGPSQNTLTVPSQNNLTVQSSHPQIQRLDTTRSTLSRPGMGRLETTRSTLLSRPGMARLETTHSTILSRHITETESIENFKTFQDSKPRLRAAEKVLATLCDVQLFTTTSVLIAAYALGKDLSYYHSDVVTNYYWFAVQSFWASRQNKWWEPLPEGSIDPNASSRRKPLRIRLLEFFVRDEPFRLYFRRFLILVCTTLFVILYGQSIQNEDDKWDPTTSGKCYRSGDASNGPSDWFWLTGIAVYGLVLLLSMVVFLKVAVASLSNLLHMSESSMFAKVAQEWKLLKSGSGSDGNHAFLRIRRAVWLCVLAIASVFWCIFVQGATNWFFGDGIYAVEVMFYIGMWAWAAFDVIDLKTSNKNLIIGNEDVWTYGQILTLALIGLILFSVMDAWETDEDKDLQASRGSLESESDKEM